MRREEGKEGGRRKRDRGKGKGERKAKGTNQALSRGWVNVSCYISFTKTTDLVSK